MLINQRDPFFCSHSVCAGLDQPDGQESGFAGYLASPRVSEKPLDELSPRYRRQLER